MGVLVFVFSLISVATLFSSCSLALTEDGVTLLEIKSTLNDSRNYLGNWQATDEFPCKWTGISCHHHDQRVRSINLPYMQLGGIISPSIGKLNRLQRLALHQNSLHGFIPNEIVSCTELRAITPAVNLYRDLSSNLLKGAIPSSLGRLTHLHHLNLSTNFFSGEIPDFGSLSTFGNKSFIGNLDLCGRQVHKPCRTSMGFPAVLPHDAASDEAAGKFPTKRSSHYMKGVLIGAMSTMGLALVVLLAFLWICLLSKKERAVKRYTEVRKQVSQEASTKLITFHGDMPYPSSEIIEKLESLDEEDVVGSGGFGTVYRMVMNDCGTFAVKRIDRSREGSDQVFERELEILGSIKHINLVNLRGYCRLPATKLLIYDYLSMGSLDDFLHEYLQSGRATEKSDVYSFGVLLLELVTGKRPTDPTFVKRGLNVVGWMNTLLKENRLEDVVDKRCTEADLETVEAILEIAASCTDANPDDRPLMNQCFCPSLGSLYIDFSLSPLMPVITSNHVGCGALFCHCIHGLLLQLGQPFLRQKCKHSKVLQELCIDCGLRMDDDYGIGFDYIQRGLRFSRDEIARLREENSKKLFDEKKLQLVLDLDCTLLHTRAYEKLTSEELDLMNRTDENVYNGAREYMEEVAKFLDPEGNYFNSRFIAREDINQGGHEHLKKRLDLVLGDKRGIVIVDDTKRVWKFNDRENLIVIGRYNYFKVDESYSEIMKTDESETDGALVNVLEVLKRIHCLFFKSRIRVGGRGDVRHLLERIRGEVLVGCVVFYSEVDLFPSMLAEALGAEHRATRIRGEVLVGPKAKNSNSKLLSPSN
ncbi:hypothetical protein EZV62_022938 [Acer yangbiense]|uniref:Protein kinase domain-containing protein n=1 Tax=Acer yangbiense TaxID=1000413 RepID=A0A5C7H052_9ROSI|nr:hypothetical protein EZV62_022938 [Acer yangbiense]